MPEGIAGHKLGTEYLSASYAGEFLFNYASAVYGIAPLPRIALGFLSIIIMLIVSCSCAKAFQ